MLHANAHVLQTQLSTSCPCSGQAVLLMLYGLRIYTLTQVNIQAKIPPARRHDVSHPEHQAVSAAVFSWWEGADRTGIAAGMHVHPVLAHLLFTNKAFAELLLIAWVILHWHVPAVQPACTQKCHGSWIAVSMLAASRCCRKHTRL